VKRAIQVHFARWGVIHEVVLLIGYQPIADS
jgi:hypothetical protein